MDVIRKPEGFEAERLFVQPESAQKLLSEHELTRSLFVSDIGFFPNARYHYRERKDGCDAHILIYCTEGKGWIERGDELFSIGSHELAVIPSGMPHRYGASAENPWSIYWFHLKGEHVMELVETFGFGCAPIQLPPGLYPKWTEAFTQCYDWISHKTYSIQAQVHASHTIRHLISTIGMTNGGSEQDKKRERYLEGAIRYMNDRLSGSITLPELARHSGLSKQHLIYLFKRETGCSPIEYFLRLKMQRASQLLDLTDMSVKEIGGAVGMSDPYYFSRLFKKRMGCSPTEYRKIPKG